MEIKKCRYCDGLGGMRTRRSYWQDCQHCLATGYGWRPAVVAKLFYWRHFKPSMYPQFEYDQFSPTLYPPYPWTCRGCNGVGCDLYGYEACEGCDGSGLRWAWAVPVRGAWRRLIKPWQDWRYERRMNRPLSEDEIPF